MLRAIALPQDGAWFIAGNVMTAQGGLQTEITWLAQVHVFLSVYWSVLLMLNVRYGRFPPPYGVHLMNGA